MGKKEVSVTIRARNLMMSGLKSAGKMLHSFGSGVLKVGKWVGASFLAMGAAVLAFAGKALSAYAEQQKAEMSLAAALRTHGESADALIPKLKEIASAIQDETGADDDSVISGMARMRMLGVTADKLEDAAKASIAMKSAGIEESAAARLVASAMQGNYTMLTRYLPALKGLTDETEKARIVNEFFTAGYKQQSALLNTTSGAWNALKGRVGDALEAIGEAIEKSAGIQKVLETAGAAVKKFGNAVSNWIKSEQFAELQTTITGIVNAMKAGGTDRSNIVKAMMDVVVAGFAVAAEGAVAVLKKAAPFIGRMIGAGAKAVLDAIKPVGKGAMNEAAAWGRSQALAHGTLQTGYAEGKDAGRMIPGSFIELNGKASQFIPEDSSQWSDEQKEQLKLAAQKLREEKTLAQYGLDGVDAKEGETAAQTNLNAKVAALVALAKKTADIEGDVTEEKEEQLKIADAETASQREYMAQWQEQVRKESEMLKEKAKAQEQIADSAEAAAVAMDTANQKGKFDKKEDGTYLRKLTLKERSEARMRRALGEASQERDVEATDPFARSRPSAMKKKSESRMDRLLNGTLGNDKAEAARLRDVAMQERATAIEARAKADEANKNMGPNLAKIAEHTQSMDETLDECLKAGG